MAIKTPELTFKVGRGHVEVHRAGLFENAVQGTSSVYKLVEAWRNNPTVFIVSGGTPAGGTMIVEAAHSDTYTGTWDSLQTSTGSANAVIGYPIGGGTLGMLPYVRARMNGSLTAGSMSAYLFWME